MNAFRKKQEELKRLREQEATGGATTPPPAAGGGLATETTPPKPLSAAERFRAKKAASGTSTVRGTSSASSSTSGKSAANYFLKKKKSTRDEVEQLTLSEGEFTAEQYKAMYERAVKDNQLLVKKYNEKAREVKQLKSGGATTAARMSRTSKIVSREQRMSMAMSTQLGSQLGSLLTLVQNLDMQIKSSEAARQYAEEKLIEIALRKIDLTEALKKVDDALEKIVARMRGGGSVDKELVANILTKIRKDILGADVEEPAATKVGQLAPEVTPQRGGLLAQIRGGVQLTRIDVENLKKRRNKERIKTARQSVRMMASLEDTLRQALEMRNFEMNPDNPNEVWGEDDDDWD